MFISGNVIAHKVIGDRKELGDNVSCTLPSIENATSELKGAGIMGTIDAPSLGQINSLSFEMSQRSLNKESVQLAAPGMHNIELRFVKEVMSGNGTIIPEGTKIFISGMPKKFDPGKIETATTMDGSLEFEVIRYRIVIAGKEVLLIDKLNYIYKINGVDYLQKVKAAL